MTCCVENRLKMRALPAADDAIGEQKEWLQDFLGAEFEKAGWDNGAIAWQDVAKRKADLSNDAIFQVPSIVLSMAWRLCIPASIQAHPLRVQAVSIKT